MTYFAEDDFGDEFGDDWSEDIEAVKQYLKNESPKKEESKKIRHEALRFIDNISFWETEGDWNKVASYRNKYNHIEYPKESPEIFKSGWTRNEMQGKARPVIDPDTGEYGDPEPWIPEKYKWIAAVTAVGITTLAILKKIRLI